MTDSKQPLTYRVRFRESNHHHVIEIELWIGPTLSEGEQRIGSAEELVFPVWTPGSYMVREYTRNIESLVAPDTTVSTEKFRGRCAATPWQIVGAFLRRVRNRPFACATTLLS